MSTIGCLILHGFAGDVHEVLPLVRALQARGYTIECPTLDGHGLTRRHLGKSTCRDWVRSAEEAYKRLAMRSERIVVIGFSMGGLLAAQIAVRHPVELLVTLNTPYAYWDVRQALVNLREDVRRHLSRYVCGLVRIPLRSMWQFRILLRETKQLLPRVTCPCLIVQGKRDDTVQAVSAEHLRRSVGSDQAQVSYFPRSGHLLLAGPEADEVIRLVDETIARHFA